METTRIREVSLDPADGERRPAAGRLGFAARHRLTLSLLAIGLGSCVLAFLFIGVGGPDDSYITDWAAERFAATGRIVNYNGSAIEQSTSLLHVILLGSAHWVTRLPVPLIGYLLGFAGLIATVAGAGLWVRKIDPRASLVAACLVATAFPLMYWSTSGLETLLVSSFLLLFLFTFLRFLTCSDRTLATGVSLGFAALFLAATRPDGLAVVVGLVSLVALGAFLAARGPRFATRWLPEISLRRSLLAVVSTGAAVVTLESARLAMFHSLVPQPVKAKTGGTFNTTSIRSGLVYVGHSLEPRWLWLPVLIVAAWGVVVVIRSRSLAGWMTLTTIALNVGLVIASGGDWMGAARFLVPSITLVFVLVAVGITAPPPFRQRDSGDQAEPHTAGRRQVGLLVTLLVLLEIVALSMFVSDSSSIRGHWTFNNGAPVTDSWSLKYPDAPETKAPSSIPWYERRNAPHLRDAVFVERAIPRIKRILERMPNAREQLTIGSGQAGLVPYEILKKYPDRIHFIDRGNLSTDDFADCHGLPHASYGSVVSYAYWEKNAGACAPQLPDVIIELGLFGPPDLRSRYDLVFQQRLLITRKGMSPPFIGGMYVAVRKGFLTPRATS